MDDERGVCAVRCCIRRYRRVGLYVVVVVVVVVVIVDGVGGGIINVDRGAGDVLQW